MPEPIGSIPRAKILENYRTVNSLGPVAPVAVPVDKHRERLTDTVEISREARQKLRQASQAKLNDQQRREQMRLEQDDALKKSLEVLELGTETSRETIRRAYRHLIRSYHPDKYSHLPPEFRKLAEMKARQIIEAYDRLIDE